MIPKTGLFQSLISHKQMGWLLERIAIVSTNL